MFRTNINDNISYKLALYIRLSREDGDDLESESIANQRDYLLKFLRDNNLEYHYFHYLANYYLYYFFFLNSICILCILKYLLN